MFKQIIVFLFFLFLSCKKEEVKQQKIIDKKPEMKEKVSHKKTVKLTELSLSKIKIWKEYNEVNDFLTLFKNTSPSQGLNNAIELKGLVKNLKDSIRIEELKIPSFKARINVLENEALRLADMTYIPAITPAEVNSEIDKIFLVFSSLNAKINTFYHQKEYDKSLEGTNFFELDSSEIKINPKNNTPNL